MVVSCGLTIASLTATSKLNDYSTDEDRRQIEILWAELIGDSSKESDEEVLIDATLTLSLSWLSTTM